MPSGWRALANRCGPRALKRLLGETGLDVPLSRIAALSGSGPDGCSLAGLERAAKALGMEARVARWTAPGIPGGRFIGHLAHGHFVHVAWGEGGLRLDGRPQADPARFLAEWSGCGLFPVGPEKEKSYAQRG